jgi:hypothetical protein
VGAAFQAGAPARSLGRLRAVRRQGKLRSPENQRESLPCSTPAPRTPAQATEGGADELACKPELVPAPAELTTATGVPWRPQRVRPSSWCGHDRDRMVVVTVDLRSLSIDLSRPLPWLGTTPIIHLVSVRSIRGNWIRWSRCFRSWPQSYWRTRFWVGASVGETYTLPSETRLWSKDLKLQPPSELTSWPTYHLPPSPHDLRSWVRKVDIPNWCTGSVTAYQTKSDPSGLSHRDFLREIEPVSLSAIMISRVWIVYAACTHEHRWRGRRLLRSWLRLWLWIWLWIWLWLWLRLRI